MVSETMLDLTLPTPYSCLRQFLQHVRLPEYEQRFRQLGAMEVDDLLHIVHRHFKELQMTRHQRMRLVRQLVARRVSIEDVQDGIEFGYCQQKRVCFADYCEFLQTANATEVVIKQRPMGFALKYEAGDMLVKASTNQFINPGWVLKWVGNVNISIVDALAEDEILLLINAMQCPFNLAF